MDDQRFATVDEAGAILKSGHFIIVLDNMGKLQRGHLLVAADYANTDAINFMQTNARGLICLAVQGSILDRLHIPQMVAHTPDTGDKQENHKPFSVSVDAVTGVGFGDSAPDLSNTIRTLLDQNSTSSSITMPGHVHPLRAHDNGVLGTKGVTEASVDLARIADLSPAAAICSILSADGSAAKRTELTEFGIRHQIPFITTQAIAKCRLERESTPSAGPLSKSNIASRIGTSKLPTEHGEFMISIFRDPQGIEHSALVMGNPKNQCPLVRMHSECLTGDAFGSMRCDCGPQLQSSLTKIAKEGCGVLLYLKQEGRGIGLGNKIRAYELQDQGLDTVDANQKLGFPADGRDYAIAGAMLSELGISSIRLLTNNPQKRMALEKLGIEIKEQLPLIIEPQEHNSGYLQTKAIRLGHSL